MNRRDQFEEMLAAWARILFGADRAAEVAPSLTERAGHLQQVSQAGLGHDEEPAIAFRPDALVSGREEP
jgi:hypothetical protein